MHFVSGHDQVVGEYSPTSSRLLATVLRQPAGCKTGIRKHEKPISLGTALPGNIPTERGTVKHHTVMVVTIVDTFSLEYPQAWLW